MLDDAYAQRLQNLYPRQRVVVDLLAQGYDDDEVAHALSISREAVKTQVWHALRYLNLPTRVALVVWVHSGLRRDKPFVPRPRRQEQE